MSYEKQTWVPYDETLSEEENIKRGAVVTAPKLNKMEEGISYAHTDLKKHADDDKNPHKVNADQVGAYSKEELDILANGYRSFSKATSRIAAATTGTDLLLTQSCHPQYVANAVNKPFQVSSHDGIFYRNFFSETFGHVVFIPNDNSRRTFINYRSSTYPQADNYWSGWQLLTSSAQLFGSWTLGFNENVTFEGKITGSNAVNPHRAENVSSPTIVSPSSTNLEFAQGSYDNVAKNDNLFYNNTTGVVGDRLNIPLHFNLLEQINRDYPQTKLLSFEQIIKYLTAVTFKAYVSNVNNGGGKITLYRTSGGFTANPTFVESMSTESNTIIGLTYGASAGFNSIFTPDGVAHFNITGGKVVDDSKPLGVRISHIEVGYRMSITNLIDAIFEKLDDPANRYRTSTVQGAIPQNPTWVSKNLQDTDQLDHDWVYANGLVNTPASETNSGYVKRSRVGANIQIVWFKPFSSETIYKMSKLNTDAWTNWEPDDGNGWVPNATGAQLAALPTRAMSERYATLAAGIGPHPTLPQTGMFKVTGVNTRLVANLEYMNGEIWRNTFLSPNWTGWYQLANKTPKMLTSGYNLDNLKTFPQIQETWVSPTNGISSSIVNKPPQLTNETFAIEQIPIRINTTADYATLQRLTAYVPGTNNAPRVFQRVVGMQTGPFATIWKEVGSDLADRITKLEAAIVALGGTV